MQKNDMQPKRCQSTNTDAKEKFFENIENIDQFELGKAPFLNQVSHELRTLLSVMKLRIEAIEGGMYENNDQAFKQLREKFAEF